MAVHRIELPTSVTAQHLPNVLSRCDFFPESPLPTSICVSFNPRYNFFDPVGIAMLSSWGAYWVRRGVPITLENAEAKGVAYAQRMGLFAHWSVDPPSMITEHDESGRFVRAKRVAVQEDLSLLCVEIAGVLKVPNLINMVQYVLAEMVRNTLEHSGADAYVAAQYYEKDKRVAIGVADCGCGIRASLSPSLRFQDDAKAIVAALRPGVSGATGGVYAAPDNAGLGLFYARGIAKASARLFCLASGDACFKQLKPSGEKAGLPARDAKEEHHSLSEKLKPWQGTLVGVNVRGIDGNLSSFMARMRPVVNIGRDIATAPGIRFTE